MPMHPMRIAMTLEVAAMIRDYPEMGWAFVEQLYREAVQEAADIDKSLIPPLKRLFEPILRG